MVSKRIRGRRGNKRKNGNKKVYKRKMRKNGNSEKKSGNVNGNKNRE